MKGYDIHLQKQELKQEIHELNKDIQHLMELLEKSENELEQLEDMDVVENW